MAWIFNQDKPIYTQLIYRIKLGILSGEYVPGERLESVRELASTAGVNPNTMQKALAELESHNLLFSQRTSGRYITQNNEIIRKLRLEMASEKIIEFVDEMKTLGFDLDELEKLVRKYHEEGIIYSKEDFMQIELEEKKPSTSIGNLEDILKEEAKEVEKEED